MSASDHSILEQASGWLQEGRKVAIATVVETWGSAPQPVGSQLVIDAEGNFIGSVSGGCVEGEVVSEAVDIIATGKPRLLQFGVADETAWRVGLACGGRIGVYVEPLASSANSSKLFWLRAVSGGPLHLLPIWPREASAWWPASRPRGTRSQPSWTRRFASISPEPTTGSSSIFTTRRCG